MKHSRHSAGPPASTAGSPAIDRAFAVAAMLVCVGILLVHARSFLPFVADDALISLRYAQRLLEGHGLTWNAGERVEGYSNLLWVLLCALVGRMGVDLILTARILGLVLTSAALLAPFRAVAGRRDALPAAFWGASSMALTGALAAWSIGGLEQALLAGLLAWALVLAYPLLHPTASGSAWIAPGLLLALLCWTRPDGALFSVAFCAGLTVARGPGAATFRACALIALLPATAYLGQLGFRLAYYGEWFPNSAYAKLGFTTHRLTQGSLYVGSGLGWMIALVVPALALAFWSRGSRGIDRRVRFLLAPLLIWGVYVVMIGGDIFPARRHLGPLAVIFGLLLTEGSRRLIESGATPRRWVLFGAPALLLALGVMQQLDPEVRRARTERWEWDGQVVGNLLKQSFGDRSPLLAVDAAGTLPYFSELPSIDMLGINDSYLAHNRPEDFGRGYLGHELGDGSYVLDREPDMIIFCLPSGGPRPCFRSGIELYRDPRFRQGYRLVNLEGDDPYRFRSQIWFRIEGGRIGIRRDTDRVSVPGYLLNSNPQSVARRVGEIGLAMHVSFDVPAALHGLRLEPGKWELQLRWQGAAIRSEIRESGTGRILASGTARALFSVADASASVDIFVGAPPGQTAHVGEVVMNRVRDTNTPPE